MHNTKTHIVLSQASLSSTMAQSANGHPVTTSALMQQLASADLKMEQTKPTREGGNSTTTHCTQSISPMPEVIRDSSIETSTQTTRGPAVFRPITTPEKDHYRATYTKTSVTHRSPEIDSGLLQGAAKCVHLMAPLKQHTNSLCLLGRKGIRTNQLKHAQAVRAISTNARAWPQKLHIPREV
jgi:hypothetical protein